MRLVVGMGSIDDYEPFVQAGADELFCGYVPEAWTDAFGARAPLNRREVLMCNVQLGAMSELLILKDMIRAYGVPVSLAFNCPAYTPKQRAFIAALIGRLGFSDIIAADEALIGTLLEAPGIRVHVSGEYGEQNRLTAARLRNAARIIFPRQTAIGEMASVIRAVPEPEYEAFLLNEKCHFTGAYCATLHRDELCHMCRVPYRLSGLTPPEPDGRDIPGATGCGLCALWRLRDAGVTHLKLVSRGNDTESTLRDIRAARTALSLLESADSERTYVRAMKKTLFPDGCSGECYYAG